MQDQNLFLIYHLLASPYRPPHPQSHASSSPPPHPGIPPHHYPCPQTHPHPHCPPQTHHTTRLPAAYSSVFSRCALGPRPPRPPARQIHNYCARRCSAVSAVPCRSRCPDPYIR